MNRTAPILAGTLLALSLVFPLVSSAVVNDDESTGVATSGIQCPSPALSSTLSRGQRDSNTNGQVSDLQGFLADYFDLPDNFPTGYFGLQTEGYIKKFQAQKGVEQVGWAGRLTRAAILKACTGTSASVSTTNTNTGSNPAQTNPVVIHSFSASSLSVASGGSVTFSWNSNLSSSDLSYWRGGCYINGLTTGNREVYVVSGTAGTGVATFTPTATATYTLRCMSGGKDSSPDASKSITVNVGAADTPSTNSSGTVASIAALQSGNYSSYASVSVQGYATAGDGGQGTFTYRSGSCTADGGITIKDSAGNCFVRNYSGAITAEWFGAVKGLYADNSSAINSAVAYLAGKGGGQLNLPGKYGVASTINLRSNITYACTSGQSVLRALSFQGIIGDSLSPVSYSNITIQNCEFDGNQSAITGITVDDANGNAIALANVSNATVQNNYVHHTVYNGILLYDQSHKNKILNNRIENIGTTASASLGTTSGVFLDFGPSNNIVQGNTVNGTKQYGLWLGDVDADNRNNQFLNNTVSGALSDGIRIADDRGGSNTSYNATVSGNDVRNNGGVGIRVQRTGAGAYSGTTVSNNMVANNGSVGIIAAAGAVDTKITGNTISNNSGYGISIGGLRTVVSGNTISGNASGRINDGGTSTTGTDVAPVVPTITADLKVNGSNGPLTIADNQSINLSWTSTGAAYCILANVRATSGALPAGYGAGYIVVGTSGTATYYSAITSSARSATLGCYMEGAEQNQTSANTAVDQVAF